MSKLPGQLRPTLLAPNLDDGVLSQTLELVCSIYALHERGKNYDRELQDLRDLTGQQIEKGEVCRAFGSVSEETWVRDLLREHTKYPDDLTHDEMRQLLIRIIEADGEEWQSSYWLECLERNTGCRNLTDLIYYPEEYFGEDVPEHELSVEEILSEALSSNRRRKRAIITLPPSEPPN